VPPKVDVCERRYVFNQMADGNAAFVPTQDVAPTTPAGAGTAYQSYKATYQAAFQSAVDARGSAPKPSILGIKEAKVVSEWTHKRARGRSGCDDDRLDAARRIAGLTSRRDGSISNSRRKWRPRDVPTPKRGDRRGESRRRRSGQGSQGRRQKLRKRRPKGTGWRRCRRAGAGGPIRPTRRPFQQCGNRVDQHLESGAGRISNISLGS